MSPRNALQYFRYEFFALGSDCVFQLYAATQTLAHAASAQATREVFRIEARYSRYRADSELSRINAVAAAGGWIDVDPEMATLLDYAYACHRLSGGLFDITSGILRKAWEFSSDRIPGDEAIAAILPFIGLDKIIYLIEQQRHLLLWRQAGARTGHRLDRST